MRQRRVWLAAALAITGFACTTGTPQPGDPEADAATSEGTADAPPPSGDGVRLPFAVDDYFVASGYMGDGADGGITRVEECASPRPGEGRGLCHRFTWTPGAQGWAGVFWQFPEGSWGDQPGLTIASGATAVELYAWGARGGEHVKFVVGMDDVDGFHAELDAELGTEPTLLTIDLDGQPYHEVTGGFGWVAEGEVSPDLSFYIDDVHWR